MRSAVLLDGGTRFFGRRNVQAAFALRGLRRGPRSGPPARCEENRPCGRHARRGGLREAVFRRSAAVRELRLVFARLPAASISAVGRTGRKKPEAEAGVHPGKGHRRNGVSAALRLLPAQVGATGHRVRGRAVRPPRKIGPAAVAVRRSGAKDRFGSRSDAKGAVPVSGGAVYGIVSFVAEHRLRTRRTVPG